MSVKARLTKLEHSKPDTETVTRLVWPEVREPGAQPFDDLQWGPDGVINNQLYWPEQEEQYRAAVARAKRKYWESR